MQALGGDLVHVVVYSFLASLIVIRGVGRIRKVGGGGGGGGSQVQSPARRA